MLPFTNVSGIKSQLSIINWLQFYMKKKKETVYTTYNIAVYIFCPNNAGLSSQLTNIYESFGRIVFT